MSAGPVADLEKSGRTDWRQTIYGFRPLRAEQAGR